MLLPVVEFFAFAYREDISTNVLSFDSSPAQNIVQHQLSIIVLFAKSIYFYAFKYRGAPHLLSTFFCTMAKFVFLFVTQNLRTWHLEIILVLFHKLRQKDVLYQLIRIGCVEDVKRTYSFCCVFCHGKTMTGDNFSKRDLHSVRLDWWCTSDRPRFVNARQPGEISETQLPWMIWQRKNSTQGLISGFRLHPTFG